MKHLCRRCCKNYVVIYLIQFPVPKYSINGTSNCNKEKLLLETITSVFSKRRHSSYQRRYKSLYSSLLLAEINGGGWRQRWKKFQSFCQLLKLPKRRLRIYNLLFSSTHQWVFAYINRGSELSRGWGGKLIYTIKRRELSLKEGIRLPDSSWWQIEHRMRSLPSLNSWK